MSDSTTDGHHKDNNLNYQFSIYNFQRVDQNMNRCGQFQNIFILSGIISRFLVLGTDKSLNWIPQFFLTPIKQINILKTFLTPELNNIF